MTVFSAGLSTDAKNADAAARSLRFLTTPKAAAVIRSKGMETAEDMAMRAIIVLRTLLVATGTAGSAEIKALISTAMKVLPEEIGRNEKETGHKIIAAYGPVRCADRAHG